MTELGPTFGDSKQTQEPSILEAPDQSVDREAAVAELHNLFVSVTTLPFSELIPGYQEGRLADTD